MFGASNRAVCAALIVYAVWNVFVFFLYGADKLAAKRRLRRIPEATLLGCALCFGGVGAYLGMRLFRHKTKHKRFKILVPIFCVLNIAVLFFAVFYREKIFALTRRLLGYIL